MAVQAYVSRRSDGSPWPPDHEHETGARHHRKRIGRRDDRAPGETLAVEYVLVEAGETERVLRHCAHAADTSGEAVYKTILFERRAHEHANTIGFAPVESGRS